MTNDYFQGGFAGNQGDRATATQIDRMSRAIASGFDRLPGEAEIKAGLITYATEVTGGPIEFDIEARYPISAYTDGMQVVAKMPRANTGALAIRIGALQARQVLTHEGAVPPANFFSANAIVTFRYRDEGDGAGHFILQLGMKGLPGQRGVPYRFSGARLRAPDGPPDGMFQANALTAADTTAFGVAYQDFEGNDLTGYFATFEEYGTELGRGHLIISRARGGGGSSFLVTDTDTNGAPFNWIHLTVRHLSGEDLPNTSDIWGVQFVPIGKSGDVRIPDDVPRLWDGTRAEFDALVATQPNTLYAVIEPT